MTATATLREHLTKPQGADQALRETVTYPGQAYWGMTGPVKTTCRECRFWSCPPEPWYHEGPPAPASYRRDADGNLNRRRCRKYPRLSGGVEGKAIPHSAWSCRYFEPAERPATLYGRNSRLKPKKEKKVRKPKAGEQNETR